MLENLRGFTPLSYTVNPQTVLFLGYSETGFENQDYAMTTVDPTLFLKIGYAFVW